ncbi:hypothetical protein G7Y89_g4357 [Cudoniella acicularis]|uniref:Rhodopsin domain-containing protein n=1 Tax=Cudoniella acicularis TaxID=354080 RepID=A0A8H4W528_9HELO|nr:hypothetical protein G7Y89_g4357 [Cudoniella acicularis]
MASTTSDITIPFRDSPGYTGHKVFTLNIVLVTCTTVILYGVLDFAAPETKVNRMQACVVTQSSLDIRSVSYGSGAHIIYVPAELIPLWFSALVNNTLLYLVGTGFVRLSIVAFLPRLAKDLSSPVFLKAVYGVGFVVIIQTVVCFFYRLTECHPIKDVWLPPSTPGLDCVSSQQEQNNIIAHQAIGIAADLALFALPLWVINSKMMNSAKKIQVMLVFSIGIFVLATGIVRMVLLNTLLFLEDPTFHMSTIGTWTDLEGHVGLWCASFPALQPLLRLVSFKLGFRSKVQSYGHSNGGGAKKSGTGNLGGSNNWVKSTSRKSGYAMNSSGIDNDDGSARGIVTGLDDKSGTELDTLASDSSGQIHKQVEYDVRIEEIPAGRERSSEYGETHRGIHKSWVDV